MQFVHLGFVVLNDQLVPAYGGIGRRPAAAKVPSELVHLEDVPTSELVACCVGGQQGGNVHAVDVALDVFHEHVDAAVVAVDEQFAVPPPRRVPAELRSQLENDGVAHQGFIGVGPVEDPIVFLRHAEQGHVVVFALGGLSLQRVRFLWKHLRRRPSDFDGNLTIVVGGCIAQLIESGGVVDDRHRTDDARIVRNGAWRGDFDDGEGGLCKVDAAAVFLGCCGNVIQRFGVGAPEHGRARSVGRALIETRAHGVRARDVFEDAIVVILGVRAGQTGEVFLATPVAAVAIQKNVVPCKPVGHINGHGPYSIPIGVGHGMVPGNAKIRAARHVHAFGRDHFIGHIDLKRHRVHFPKRGIEPIGGAPETEPFFRRSCEQKRASG